MSRLALLILTALTTAAADDPWERVRALKPGSEVRIYRTGVRDPLLGKLDEAKAESVIVSTKTEQSSIARESILRIDARPASSGKPAVTRETKTGRATAPDARPVYGPRGTDPGGPSSSTSTGISFGGKGEFVTVYRRLPAAKN